VALLVLASTAVAGPSPALEARIEAIFAEVAASGCEFLRNGKAHDSQEAARHMRRKYEHFAEDIDSVDRFIELAGTRSLMTGRAYRVRCPGEPERATADWLRDASDKVGDGVS
jgi:hypothetical protein